MGRSLQRLAVFLTLGLWPVLAPAQDIVVVGLFADRAVVKVDGETRLLKVGERQGDLTLVAVNAQEARLRIGNREQTLGLGQDRGGIQASSADKGTVEISANGARQFIVGGMINGRAVSFLVDTGANTVSMNRREADRLGIDYRRFGEAGLSSTASGTVKTWRVLLARVKVGPITVSSVEANVRDVVDDIPILLGMSFLGRIKLEHEQDRLRLSAK